MCTGSTVSLLTCHSNDACVSFLITIAGLFYISGKAGDYTNAKLELERNAVCVLVITYLIMILNTCIFLIPGSRMVAGECFSRVVMLLPCSWAFWIPLESQRRIHLFLIHPCKYRYPIPISTRCFYWKQGLSRMLPFSFRWMISLEGWVLLSSYPKIKEHSRCLVGAEKMLFPSSLM